MKCISKMGLWLFWQNKLLPHITPILSVYLFYKCGTEPQSAKWSFTHFGDHCVRQSGLQDPIIYSLCFLWGLVWLYMYLFNTPLLAKYKQVPLWWEVYWVLFQMDLLTLGKASILDKWNCKLDYSYPWFP